MKIGQSGFADIGLGNNGKAGRVLDKIDAIIDWDRAPELVRAVDGTSDGKGGAPYRDIPCKAEMLFLQHPATLATPNSRTGPTTD